MSAARTGFDLVIYGATPAGAAAALRAGQLGLRALLLDPAASPRGPGRLDWLGPVGTALCRTCGLDPAAVGAAEFKGVKLYDWNLARSSKVSDAKLAGWIVDRADFDLRLCQAARQGGAAAEFGVRPAELDLGETGIRLRAADGREFRGSVLLIADGMSSPLAEMARLPLAVQADSVTACVAAELPNPGAAAGLDIVVGARRAGQTVTLLQGGGRLRLILATRESDPPPEAQFEEFVAAARAAELIPPRAAVRPTRGQTPAGAALDLDSHIGKRSVLVGEAGGFVSAFSNEAVYPCMKSGWMAAEAVARARAAPVLQDELAAFSSLWRSELADYLRPPNTDLALLIPLVFKNAQMAARVARAFLLGQRF
jgi:flavin-dependent dehydrogenase